MYDSLVHIHAIGIQKKRTFCATWLKFEALVLEMPKNGMWRLERLGAKLNM